MTQKTAGDAGHQQIVDQLANAIKDNPQMLKSFGVDPGAMIEKVTGIKLGDEQVAEVVGALTSALQGKGFDIGDLGDLAQNLMKGDALQSILGSVGGLFGGKK
ncbi:hypothetical protein [Bifidobacterium eulemuris]|uniref:Homocitrate synthase n=1 Tax=Bifidobacterium eulemuris TaxID=1765219 RepID=A0A261GDJ4_9BIFI|nr:hypothetical protein [Bifidobacterium eulemuris]OZG69323.1 isopropylmalate/homocitrate/citramalate synthase [Bifidobacterium eulemuris]QOL31179.1 homocitrate synthase [Bifidobacterium eulemuris]